MATEYSYDLANPIRDVQEAFESLIVASPFLLGLIPRGPDWGGSPGSAAGPKHEWQERQLSQTTFTVASFDVDGDNVGINFTSTTGMAAGDIITFESSTGQHRAGAAQIASVDSGTDLTIVRDYGADSISLDTIVVGDIAKIVKPVVEGSSAAESTYDAPSMAYNHPVILQRAVKIAKTQLGIPAFGKVSEINGAPAEKLLDAMHQKMLEIIWEQNQILIKGVRAARSTADTKGMAGGFIQFLTGGNVNTTGGVISLDHINDTLQDILEGGNAPGEYALVLNYNQARKLSALNTAGTNPSVFVTPQSNVAGQSITKIFGDLPGNIANVLTEPNMPKDMVIVADMTKVEINYLAGRTITDTDAVSNKAEDFVMRRLLTEFTFTIRNGTKSHGLITGLDV